MVSNKLKNTLAMVNMFRITDKFFVVDNFGMGTSALLVDTVRAK
jgi:hypothetical protein